MGVITLHTRTYIYMLLTVAVSKILITAQARHTSSPFFRQQRHFNQFNIHNKKTKKSAPPILHRQLQQQPWQLIPRGGDATGTTTPTKLSFVQIVIDALKSLQSHTSGAKSDTLLLLFTTALNTPLCKLIGLSPILGFLFLGIVLGPNGRNCISDIHTTELLADLGVVLFLFEMGIHLSFDTLVKMKLDVFGLGGSQFLITALVIGSIAKFIGNVSTAAAVIIGGGLALSSSAFVLQLLKDTVQLNTAFGQKSFGVLLLQDLAVVPLLVATPILAGDGGELTVVLASAFTKACLALGVIALVGKLALRPVFEFVVERGQSQEAFLGLILGTVLGMSFLTEGLGLSNTLGAFLAGVLLSDTKFRHDVEREISPFRGILVGLFFFSVGFEIDLDLIRNKFGLVMGIVGGIVILKAAIAAGVCLGFGLPLSTAQRVGLILSQGGEFAFVAFRFARSFGILDEDLTKLLLTCVSLTMATTPFLDEFGAKFAKKLEDKEEEDTKKLK